VDDENSRSSQAPHFTVLFVLCSTAGWAFVSELWCAHRSTQNYCDRDTFRLYYAFCIVIIVICERFLYFIQLILPLKLSICSRCLMNCAVFWWLENDWLIFQVYVYVLWTVRYMFQLRTPGRVCSFYELWGTYFSWNTRTRSKSVTFRCSCFWTRHVFIIWTRVPCS
jgi:hypothetical protein